MRRGTSTQKKEWRRTRAPGNMVHFAVHFAVQTLCDTFLFSSHLSFSFFVFKFFFPFRLTIHHPRRDFETPRTSSLQPPEEEMENKKTNLSIKSEDNLQVQQQSESKSKSSSSVSLIEFDCHVQLSSSSSSESKSNSSLSISVGSSSCNSRSVGDLTILGLKR